MDGFRLGGAKVLTGTIHGIHQPQLLAFSLNFRQVDIHGSTRVVIDKEVVFASCSNETVVSFSFFTDDDGGIGNTVVERKGEHEMLEVLELVSSWCVECFLP